MKNLVYLLMILFSMSSLKAKSQTAIQIYSMSDSLGMHCVTPAYSGVHMTGLITGYPTGTQMEVFIDFGDGSDTTFAINTYGTYYYFSIYPLHTYLFPGSYSVTGKITGPDSNFDEVINLNQAIVSNNCENISGHIFVDENSNCVFDGNDFGISYVQILLKQNSNIIDISYTDIQGNYSFQTIPGNYEIIVNSQNSQNLNSFIPVCGNTESVNINLTNNVSIDFLYNCVAGYDLYSTNILHFGAVPGLTHFFYTEFGLSGCYNQSGYIEIEIDPIQTFAYNTGNISPIVNGQILRWDFTNLNFQNFKSSIQQLIGRIYTTTSTSANLGDVICHELRVFPTINDFEISNNIYNECTIVTASFDPNMKEVFPAGIGAEGFIDANQEMTYTVHFQNTGTAPAQNVYILDTLDADLDLTTLQIIGTSHDMNLYVTPNGILKFDYPNIQLPDSSSNEPLSHGYVIYTVDQKPNLVPATEIKNTAHIYFDYNEAIITNTTLNTINSPDGFSEISEPDLKIYPNPSNGIIRIEADSSNEMNWEINDISGKLLLAGSVSGNQSIDLINLENGIYILKILESGKWINKKIEIVK